MINRRQFVTGLADAALTPALPAVSALAHQATPLFVRTAHTFDLSTIHSFQWKPETRDHIAAADRVAITSRWHVDIRAYDDATYLHCDSGLLFAVYPERPRLIWQLCAARDLPVPKSFIGHAAVLARESVIDHAYGRRARPGCFIVDFKDPACDPTEDAPPLPRVERFAADPDAPQGV